MPRKKSAYTIAAARSGIASASRQAADDRDEQCEGEDDGLRHDHQLQVELEPGPDLRDRAKEVEWAEELMQELAQLDLLRFYAVVRTAPTSGPEPSPGRSRTTAWCNRLIVPFFSSVLIALLTSGMSGLFLANTAP